MNNKMSKALDDRSDDDNLKELLSSFDLDVLFDDLKSNGISYRCLKYVSKSDIKDAISNIGLRAEFRQKLFAWRKAEFNIDDDTLSVDSKVKKWLEKSLTPNSTSNSSGIQIQTKSSLDVGFILRNSSKGRGILINYEKKSSLSNFHREQLINLIVEEANCNDITIRTSDYNGIVDQIVSLFPSECEAKEFYFIPRTGRKNPGGKLYAKYTNSRAKRPKFHRTPSTEVADNSLKLEPEFDENISSALKTELKRDFADWNAVTDKWHKTFCLRRRDLSSLDPVQFIKEWPKFTDSRAIDLFKIDFSILFPGKEHILYSKWDVFRTKIELYYRENLHNECCKKLLNDLQLAETPDSSDFILTNLLPFVLPPTSWYKSDKGKKYKIKFLLYQQENVYIVCNNVEVERFCSHMQAYEVSKRNPEVLMFEILYFTSHPMHLYQINNGKSYIRYKSL